MFVVRSRCIRGACCRCASEHSDLANRAAADEPPPPSKHVNYSPVPEQELPGPCVLGDTHLHTSYSTDAGMTGTMLGPEEAYRFARGEAVKSNHGAPVQLQRAYDFLVVSDHAENLGLAPLIAESNPELLKSEWGKKVHDLVKAGKGFEAYNVWGAGVLARQDPLKAQGQTVARPAWQRITAAAEKYNEPGRFTAIIGFEWSAGPNGNNLHRNILFRDGKDKADQIIPLSSLRHRRPGRTVDLDGRLREQDGWPAAGDPAQRQLVERPDVRRRHADDQEAARSRLCRARVSAGSRSTRPRR